MRELDLDLANQIRKTSIENMEIKRKGTGTKENTGCKDHDIKTPANASCIHGHGTVSAGLPNSTGGTAGLTELVVGHDFGRRLAPLLPSFCSRWFFHPISPFSHSMLEPFPFN